MQHDNLWWHKRLSSEVDEQNVFRALNFEKWLVEHYQH